MKLFPFIILLWSVVLVSCEKKEHSFNGKLHYEVQCDDADVKKMVHRYFGPGFDLQIQDSVALLSRTWESGEVRHFFTNGIMQYQEEVEGRCLETSLKGDLLEYFRLNSAPDSIVYLDETDEWQGFTIYKALVYDEASLPEGPAEAWYTKEIRNYWPYLPDMPGMFVKYRYSMRGVPVDYVLVSSERDLESAPTLDKTDCDHLFPEVFVINPSIGTPYNADYHVHGDLILEEFNNPIAYASIEIYRNDSLYYEASSDSVGYYSFYLPLGHLYHLKYRGDGFSSRIIELDTRLSDDVDVSGGFESRIVVPMFYDEGNDVVAEFVKRPMGKCRYDQSSEAFIFDFEYTENFSDSLKILRKNSLSKAK